MSGSKRSPKPNIIIIRREEVVEAGHHGGAWKVAYADFVTAMMAFFLLMWLLNATTEEQRRGIADYFAPTNQLSRGASGSGMPFGGKTPFDSGNMVSDSGTISILVGNANEQPDPPDDPVDKATPVAKPPSAAAEATQNGTQSFDAHGTTDKQDDRPAKKLPGAGASDSLARVSPDARALALVGSKAQQAAALAARAEAAAATTVQAERGRQEGQAFERAADQIRDAVRGDKLLAELSRQISIDQTPEGLRIQLLDEDRRSMFASGASVMEDRARLLLQKVAPVLAGLSQQIAISGHTDATPFRGTDKTNWELSSERANATRRLLVEAGLPETRFRSVTGNADRDPLLPGDPMAAANRRIAIVVLRQVQIPPATITPTPVATPPSRPTGARP